MSELVDDLKQRIGNGVGQDVDEAINATVEPLQAKLAEIKAVIAEADVLKSDLEAHGARIERMLDAARLRKKPGRKPGARKQPEREGAPA